MHPRRPAGPRRARSLLCAGLVCLSACDGGAFLDLFDATSATTTPGGDEPEPVEILAGDSLVRRLTRTEYRYSVEDALGFPLGNCSPDHPPETRTQGFTNTAVGLVVTAEHVDAYLALAECAATKVSSQAAWVAAHSTCQSFLPACQDDFVQRMGLRLFRRPLEQEEVTAFAALFDAASAEALSFSDGAGLVVSAMLQSPQFLYRIETEQTDQPGQREVTAYELATRLSYFLWSSGPDAALLEAARTGVLETSQGQTAEVDRMLADVRSVRSIEQFAHDAWALDGLSDLVRADLPASIGPAMAESVVRTYRAHAETAQPIAEVLASPKAILNEELAAFIGLSPQGTGWSTYELPAEQDRRGLLSHPAVLTVMADRDVGGIVARGLYMMENVLCAEPLSPPPNLDLSMFRSHLGPGATERQYSEDRLANSSCAACHRQFDPLAYAFERFDGAGRFRPVDAAGNSLRSDGALVTSEGTRPYASATEYAALLADDAQVQQCFTGKQLQFALGRTLSHTDDAAVEQIHAEARAGGLAHRALVKAVALHPLFRLIRTE